MTQPPDLIALAERCEAAEGPDCELDKRIAAVNGWCLHPSDRQRDDSAQSDTGFTCLDCGADSWGNTGPTGQKRSAPLPAYTASLDAALTLVPEWCLWWRVEMDCEGHWARVQGGPCEGATPALALTAAALRALAAQDPRP